MSKASLAVALLLGVIWWSARSGPNPRQVRERRTSRSSVPGGGVSSLASLFKRRQSPKTILLGSTFFGRKYLPSTDSLLVFGPTRSGKTLRLALPLLDEFNGAAVATSVKQDLYERSVAARKKRGECCLFDLSDPKSAPWSLLSCIKDFRDAKEISDSLCKVAHSTSAEIEFWSRLGSKMLAPLLLAAKELDASLGEMIGWIERQDFDYAFEGLLEAGHIEARVALDAVMRLDQRAVSSVIATLLSLMEPYSDPVVSDLLSREGIDLELLLDRRKANTLYISSPLFRSERFYGVYEVFLRRVFDIAYRSDGGDPKILFLLDEIANIAPIQDLGKIASTCGGYGIVLVSVFQDLTQLGAIYSANAGTIVNNHRSKLLLSGISDHATLDYAEKIVKRGNVSGEGSNPLFDLRLGTGLYIQANAKPVRLQLRPFPRQAHCRLCAALARFRRQSRRHPSSSPKAAGRFLRG